MVRAMPLEAQHKFAEPSTAVKQQVAGLAEMRAVHAAFEWFRARAGELSERQLELTRIPAPPFGEQPRAEWLRARFAETGLQDVHIDEAGNVLGVRPGRQRESKYVALTAHIDTVFPAGTALEVRREGEKLMGPGMSDNGCGVVALLAIAQAMQQADLPNTAPVLFIGNVGEEGEGDLRGMRHIFAQSKWKDLIGPTLVLDGAGAETIVTQALGSRRLEVTAHGVGGHSWSDFGVANPIVSLARVVDRFSRTPVPSNPRTTFNVGVIRGGTSVNSIPESASMRVDIRSASLAEIDRLEQALRDEIAEVTANEAGALKEKFKSPREVATRFEVKLIGDRPGAEIPPDANILQVIHAVDAQLGLHSRPQRASTDANIPMSMGREAIAIGGGGSGGGAHTLHEWYDPTNRDLGLKRILLAVLALAGVKE